MSRSELYISIDIETNGPAPGVNSMLSLGAAAFLPDGEELGVWYETLEPLPDSTPNDETMSWWATQPAAWAEVNRMPQNPMVATRSFVSWCEDLERFKLIAVGWPISFDFAFVNYYCWRYGTRNPLGFAGLDIRSFANGLAGYPDYYGLPEATVRAMAGPIDTAGLRPHVAVDDAVEQGRLFMGLRRVAVHRQEARKSTQGAWHDKP